MLNLTIHFLKLNKCLHKYKYWMLESFSHRPLTLICIQHLHFTFMIFSQLYLYSFTREIIMEKVRKNYCRTTEKFSNIVELIMEKCVCFECLLYSILCCDIFHVYHFSCSPCAAFCCILFLLLRRILIFQPPTEHILRANIQYHKVVRTYPFLNVFPAKSSPECL